MTKMYNITLKPGGNEDTLKEAKERAQQEGGIIRHEYTLIKGFTVEFANDAVHTLESSADVHVEQDGKATTR